MLEVEGLPRYVPRKGTVVTEFAKQNMEQITILLSVMDSVADYLAVSRLNEKSITELAEFLALARGYLNDYNL